MIDALILDLGNVLAFHDNEKLFAEMARVFGTSREAMRQRLDGGLWHEVNTGRLPGDSLRRELIARLGHEVSPVEWFNLWNCHFTLHDSMIRETERLVGRLRLVLLSNTHDQHIEYLRPLLPVLSRFDGLVLSYEVGHMKPDREIYERALEVAQVPASRAAFFDDVQRYADAANSLGMHGRVFTTTDAFREQLRALRPDLVD
ncbi:MAG: HAD-IA family hydrolase [Archangiaceae bacterium]|nr:HAD-IA family hydrolase [Archangiaceae bacterium]